MDTQRPFPTAAFKYAIPLVIVAILSTARGCMPQGLAALGGVSPAPSLNGASATTSDAQLTQLSLACSGAQNAAGCLERATQPEAALRGQVAADFVLIERLGAVVQQLDTTNAGLRRSLGQAHADNATLTATAKDQEEKLAVLEVDNAALYNWGSREEAAHRTTSAALGEAQARTLHLAHDRAVTEVVKKAVADGCLQRRTSNYKRCSQDLERGIRSVDDSSAYVPGVVPASAGLEGMRIGESVVVPGMEPVEVEP